VAFDNLLLFAMLSTCILVSFSAEIANFGLSLVIGVAVVNFGVLTANNVV